MIFHIGPFVNNPTIYIQHNKINNNRNKYIIYIIKVHLQLVFTYISVIDAFVFPRCLHVISNCDQTDVVSLSGGSVDKKNVKILT